MDFTPELTAFQGVLISADNVHSFSKISARGGNEDKIDYILKSIYKYLEHQQCIHNNRLNEEKTAMMRKFALYIILNADLTALHNLKADGIDTVIWTIPTIPKCLMCEMLWNLCMEKFLYEIIKFSYPKMALEVAQACISHIKYFTPAQSLSKLKPLGAACYSLICRLSFFKDIWKDCLTSAFNIFQQCINYFIDPPNVDKLNQLNKGELYKYQGHSLHTLLLLLQECFGQFTKTEEFKPSDFHDIYEITHEEGSVSQDKTPFTVNQTSNKTVLEYLDKCNMILLDKCTVAVMDVSVDIFCAWSEYEENGKSIQQTIGELCYTLRTKLSSIVSVADHQLLIMIQQISRKPEELDDIISSADAETIIRAISKDGDDKAKWIRALIHNNQLCGNIKLLQLIDENLKALTEDECFQLYKVLRNYLDNSNENQEYIELLTIKAFQCCNDTIKQDILNDHFKDNLFDMLETVESNNMMTHVFNKLVASPEGDLTDTLGLFLHSPQRVYTKIFSLAIENTHLCDIMLRVMKLFERFSNHYYSSDTEPCLIRITQNCFDNELDTEAKESHLVKFIYGLKKSGIIPGAKLLLLVIMPKLHKAIVDNSITGIRIQCKLLFETFPLDELLQYRAPMLAMLAQVVDRVRWKINTFVAEAPSTLHLAITLLISLFNTYGNEIPENESKWLRSKLKNVQPLNMYYYRKLWNPPGNTFVEVISGKHIHRDMDLEELTSWLAQVLPSSTQQEWYDIWDSLAVFDKKTVLELIHNALSLVMLVEAPNRTDSSWACIMYCYRNFVLNIRYKYFKEPLTDDQISTVMQKIITTSKLIQEENVEELGATLLPLLAYMVERREDYSVNILNSIQKDVKSPKFLHILNKVLTKGTN